MGLKCFSSKAFAPSSPATFLSSGMNSKSDTSDHRFPQRCRRHARRPVWCWPARCLARPVWHSAGRFSVGHSSHCEFCGTNSVAAGCWDRCLPWPPRTPWSHPQCRVLAHSFPARSGSRGPRANSASTWGDHLQSLRSVSRPERPRR